MISDTDNLKLKRNLTALVEFSRIINSSLDLEFILNNILLTCMGKFLATKGLVAIKTNGLLKIKVSKGIAKAVVDNYPSINPESDFEHGNSLKQFMSGANLQT